MKGKLTIKQRLKLLTISAKKRGIEVRLNVYYYKRLLEVGCIFCGQELYSQGGYCLDRHNNDDGYTHDNVSPCCKFCNQAKGKQTPEEYFDWIKKSFKFQEGVREFREKSIIDGAKMILAGKKLKKPGSDFKKSKAFRSAKTITIEGTR